MLIRYISEENSAFNRLRFPIYTYIELNKKLCTCTLLEKKKGKLAVNSREKMPLKACKLRLNKE